ncbi:MAG: alcohol dehydrogenase catalytic domain-containing protein [Gaiellaceae bacterium]
MDRAVLLNAPGEDARVEEVVLDEPGEGEVVVRMLAVGVCHSDLYVKETDGWGLPFPIALGHEGCGVVEATGQRVVLAWRSPCGRCPACARGAPRLCRSPLRAKRRMRRASDGETVTPTLLCGCFADRVVVHAGQAIPVPDELPPEQACLLGCAVATGVGAALNTSPVWAGARVAVIGCGGVGLSVVQGARIAGAAEILAIDREPRKLVWAQRVGATETASAPPAGRRVDFAFDAVGVPATLELAVAILDHGGIATLIGLPHQDSVVALDLYELFDARAQLRVSHGGDMLPAEDIPRLAALALEGKLDLASLVTRTIALDEVEEAFADLGAGDGIRSVVRLGD